MMNSIETQPVPSISVSLPTLESPHIPIDPGNPLAWILVLTLLLGNTDEVLNAIAHLIQTIATCKPTDRKKRDRPH